MLYIQLPYGLVRNEKQLQFNLPKNHEETQYIKRLPYIRDKGSQSDNLIIDVIQNRDDLKKMAFSNKSLWQGIARRLKRSCWI